MIKTKREYICIDCGKTIYSFGAPKRCPECAEIHHRWQMKINYKHVPAKKNNDSILRRFGLKFEDVVSARMELNV